MNAFEQNYLLDLAQGSAEVGEEAKIVQLAQNCIKIQDNLRSEEERSIENTLTYFLQNAEFEQLSAKERASILARKVCAIRQDYEQMQLMVREHSGLLLGEKLDSSPPSRPAP